MSPSFIPERPLVISPTLAATIGLEEAVLFQILVEICQYRQGSVSDQKKWVDVSLQELCAATPFWDRETLRRVLASIQELGLMLGDMGSLFGTGRPGTMARARIAINETVDESSSPDAADDVQPSHNGRHSAPAPDNQHAASVNPLFSRQSTTASSSSRMSADWLPEEDWLQRCREHNIPDDFSLSLVPAFVQYWIDRGTSEFSWGNKFLRHVLYEWREEQSRRGSRERATTMSPDWWPSMDAQEILVRDGVNPVFIEDAVPEFVLYWRETGGIQSAWNSKFIEHIRRQWNYFVRTIDHDDVPRPIAEDWQPSAECYEVLQLAEIDEHWASQLVPEFVLYWRDARKARASWNTVFLQYAKQQWANRLKNLDMEESDLTNEESQHHIDSTRQRIERRLQQYADRNWAE